MADASDTDLYQRLSRGPAVLLLGQDYLRLESGADPLLAEIVRKYAPPETLPSDYHQLLQLIEPKSAESALSWIQDRCKLVSPPPWLHKVAEYPWNSLFTSAVDTVWERVFRTDWREVEPVVQEAHKPLDPRNRKRLHCTSLFGRIDRGDDAELPPTSDLQFAQRLIVAIGLLSRIPETVTPFGTLVIEGYVPRRDWLLPQYLSGMIAKLNAGQVHLFSAAEPLEDDPLIAALVAAGKLTLHSEGLGAFFANGESNGYLELGVRIEQERRGRAVHIGGRPYTIPNEIWTQVSRSAAIVDDSVMDVHRSLSQERRYREFRSFLSDSGLRPVWSGYAMGLAFSREFERGLRVEVDRALRAREQPTDPVILHGQTATGKTVALGSLSYDTKLGREFPVLHIERRSRKPAHSDIDMFCRWAEDCGASRTLVVWDGMVGVDQYHSMLQYLVGRGRKVVVVGSCYRLTNTGSRRTLIEAPSTLSAAEIADFSKFLSSFHPRLGEFDERTRSLLESATFLAALYRLLPETRGQIRGGVVAEVAVAEQVIRDKAVQVRPAFGSTLGYALLKANLIREDAFLDAEPTTIAGESIDGVQELMGYVMVPGRFGLQVPLDLLMRVCGKSCFENFVEILRDIDVFRWEEDESGGFAIGPRQSLEAKLFSQARLGGAKYEVDYAKRLLLGVRESTGHADSTEVEFAVDLVRNLGPNGPSPENELYKDHYLDLGRTLGELREKHSVVNPRLMLQEADLLIEALREGQGRSEIHGLYDEVDRVLQDALDIMSSDRRNDRLRSQLLVQLATLRGTRAIQVLAGTADGRSEATEAAQLFDDASRELVLARNLDSNNYYAIDVLGWTTEHIIKAGILGPADRAEAEVNLRYVFDSVDDQDLPVDQRERFHARRKRVGDVLQDYELSRDALRALLEQGYSYAHFLLARDMITDWPKKAELDGTQRQQCAEAATYLQDNRAAIAEDPRCMQLLLSAWWMSKAGKPLFYGERQTVGLTPADWQVSLDIVQRLLPIVQPTQAATLDYIRGLALFHLALYKEAFETFDELARESDYSQGKRRIVRSYVAGDSAGKPMLFHGTVDKVQDEGRRGMKGDVFVPEIKRSITFFPRDFGRPDIQRYEALDFHIAFNFLGPIADPPGSYKAHQGDA